MTKVIFLAPALLKAEIKRIDSIILSLTGGGVGYTMYISFPLIDSWTWWKNKKEINFLKKYINSSKKIKFSEKIIFFK